MTHRRLHRTCVVATLLFFLFSGCAFFTLEEELEEFEDTFLVGGKITNQSPHQKDVVVVAYEDTSGEKAAVKAMISEPSGEYAMDLNRGNYILIAFEDLNGNLKHDSGEYVGWYGNPDRIEVNKENMPADTPHGRKDLDFIISDSKPFPAGFSSHLPVSIKVDKGSALVYGELITFMDKKMEAEYGNIGYWQPLTFLREVGVGISL